MSGVGNRIQVHGVKAAMNVNFKIGMMTLIFSAAAVFSVASVGHGKREVERGWRVHAFQKARMSVIADKLGLSPDQRAKLKEMRKQTATTVQTIRGNASLTPAQKHAQIAAVREATRGQMKSVLTDVQKGKLAQILSNPRQLNRQTVLRMKRVAIANRLGLSPEQRAKIHEIVQKTTAAVKPLRTDTTLSPDARREKVQQLRQESRKEVLAVLTPDQTKELGRMRHRMLAALGPLS